jgi:UDP-glucuronate 4-epimerase
MSTVLITGGAGFIGSHLCEALLRLGHEVVALDNFDDFYSPSAKRHNLEALLKNARFSLIEGDIRDGQTVQRAVSADVEAVVHLAARAGVRPSIEQPILYEDVNVRGTLTLLEACRKRPGLRFVFGSSSSVYGNNARVPFSEEDRVDAPISPYAATKLAGELLCRTYHQLYGMSISCLRFFTVYGPRQRPDLAIHKFVRLIEAGRPIPVFGDGTTARDYTYIDDVISGLMGAIHRCKDWHVYNLGGAHPITLNDLINHIEQATGRTATRQRHPAQAGDVERTAADIALAARDLGFRPTTDFATGLARFVRWFREQAEYTTVQVAGVHSAF